MIQSRRLRHLGMGRVNMLSVLIVTNHRLIKPELINYLRKEHAVSTVNQMCEGLELIKSNHFDVFIVISKKHIEKATWTLIQEIQDKRSIYEPSTFVPFIFISEEQGDDLPLYFPKSHDWFFVSYPITLEEFIPVMDTAAQIARAFDSRVITLKNRKEKKDYLVRQIIAVKRKGRTIFVYNWNPNERIIEERAYYYDPPFLQFFSDYEIEKYFEQARENWCVNPNHINSVKTADQKLVMTGGLKVPVTFMENF